MVNRFRGEEASRPREKKKLVKPNAVVNISKLSGEENCQRNVTKWKDTLGSMYEFMQDELLLLISRDQCNW